MARDYGTYPTSTTVSLVLHYFSIIVNTVFVENLVGLGFFYSVSYITPIQTHEKLFAVGKSGPNATLNLFSLGLGWP